MVAAAASAVHPDQQSPVKSTVNPAISPQSGSQLVLVDAAVQEFALNVNAGLIAILSAETSPMALAALERRLRAYKSPANWIPKRTVRYA